jgi:hypothetical protein
MKKIAIVIATLSLPLLMQPDIAVAAPGGGKGGHGFKGSHGFHFGGHKHSMHGKGSWWKNKGVWYPVYGGVYATQPATVETVAVPVPVATEESRPCQRVQQAITVRSEDGGERVVSVTRCQN